MRHLHTIVMLMQAMQEERNPDPNPDPDPDPDPNTRTRAGTRAGEQGGAGTIVGTQGQRRHSFECGYSTADPNPTLSQVDPVPTQKAVPALDQVSGTSTSTRGTGMGNAVGDTDDELSQGEVVYEVPSVADILLLLQRSTPPVAQLHLGR